MQSNITIAEIMQKDVFTVTLDDTVHRADEIMREENVRHVPVLDGDKFYGMITERSIMEYSLRMLYDFHDNTFGEDGLSKINDFQHILTDNIYKVFPEDSVKKAIEIMVKRKIDCMPVVDWNGNLQGIITSADILIYILHKINEQQ